MPTSSSAKPKLEAVRRPRRHGEKPSSRVADRSRRPPGYRTLVTATALAVFDVLDDWDPTPRIDEAEIDLMESVNGLLK
jgi:hypothetical protein